MAKHVTDGTCQAFIADTKSPNVLEHEDRQISRQELVASVQNEVGNDLQIRCSLQHASSISDKPKHLLNDYLVKGDAAAYDCIDQPNRKRKREDEVADQNLTERSVDKIVVQAPMHACVEANACSVVDNNAVDKKQHEEVPLIHAITSHVATNGVGEPEVSQPNVSLPSTRHSQQKLANANVPNAANVPVIISTHATTHEQISRGPDVLRRLHKTSAAAYLRDGIAVTMSRSVDVYAHDYCLTIMTLLSKSS